MSRAAAALDVGRRTVDRSDYSPARRLQTKAQGMLRVLGQDEEAGEEIQPLLQRAERHNQFSFAQPLPLENRQSRYALSDENDFDEWPDIYAYEPQALYSSWPGSQYETTPQYGSQFYPDYAPQLRPVQAFRARLGLTGKRLPLFVILALMSVGLVVAITPALARGHIPARSNLSISSFMIGSSGPLASNEVPIIDVRSDQSAVVPEVKPVAEVQDAKPGELVGPPSISVTQIEVVLKQYGSPAAGKGQVLYDLGVKYGIDPAYALAFFVHESGCGTKGVARFTKSLGNIRTTPGYADYQGYRSYPTWESGMEDWYKLITNLYIGEWGLRTVDAIIPVYAPWGDNNNPPSYIASVKNMVNSWRGK